MFNHLMFAAWFSHALAWHERHSFLFLSTKFESISDAFDAPLGTETHLLHVLTVSRQFISLLWQMFGGMLVQVSSLGANHKTLAYPGTGSLLRTVGCRSSWWHSKGRLSKSGTEGWSSRWADGRGRSGTNWAGAVLTSWEKSAGESCVLQGTSWCLHALGLIAVDEM